MELCHAAAMLLTDHRFRTSSLLSICMEGQFGGRPRGRDEEAKEKFLVPQDSICSPCDKSL